LTEIIEYLRLLVARAGTVYCLHCGQVVQAATAADVVRFVESLPAGTRFSVGFPAAADDLGTLREEGFIRLQIDGRLHRLDETLPPLTPTPLPGGEKGKNPPLSPPGRGVGGEGSSRIWVLTDRLEAGRVTPERLT